MTKPYHAAVMAANTVYGMVPDDDWHRIRIDRPGWIGLGCLDWPQEIAKAVGIITSGRIAYMRFEWHYGTIRGDSGWRMTRRLSETPTPYPIYYSEEPVWNLVYATYEQWRDMDWRELRSLRSTAEASDRSRLIASIRTSVAERIALRTAHPEFFPLSFKHAILNAQPQARPASLGGECHPTDAPRRARTVPGGPMHEDQGRVF